MKKIFALIVILAAIPAASPQNMSQQGNADRARAIRESNLRRCMVYLPEMADHALRQWCLQKSKRMP